jgi:hypothetical protein
MLQHIVLLKFVPEATPEDIDTVFARVGELQTLIPGIVGFEWGANNSPEGRSFGYSHGFLMTFTDAAARDGYLPHPEHQRVVAANAGVVESVFVFDF